MRTAAPGVCVPCIAGVVLALLAVRAHAEDASTYLLVPTVVEGEREIDARFGVGSSGRATRGESNAGLGFGLGVTERWFTEVALQVKRAAPGATTWDTVEWENIFPLAEQNEWPVDVGLAVEVDVPHASNEGPSFFAGPLLQKEFGRMQVNCNVLLGRYVHDNAVAATQILYQAQAKYRYREPFEFGVQAFGTLSAPTQTWTGYAAQLHRVGPVALGRIVLPGERSISYNIGFLLGTTAQSPDRTLRMQIEYEF